MKKKKLLTRNGVSLLSLFGATCQEFINIIKKNTLTYAVLERLRFLVLKASNLSMLQI